MAVAFYSTVLEHPASMRERPLVGHLILAGLTIATGDFLLTRGIHRW